MLLTALKPSASAKHSKSMNFRLNPDIPVYLSDFREADPFEYRKQEAPDWRPVKNLPFS